MKTILCFGDLNTWGVVPFTSDSNVMRYSPNVRWGGVLRTTLGADNSVIEEGLRGRTTVWPDPIEGEHKCGKTYLPPCLESHQPIDLVVLMLGTNDLKHKFGLSAADIAAGAATLVDIIQRSTTGPNNSAPSVLLICAPPIARLSLFADMFEGAQEKSRQLARFYSDIAASRHCEFLDAGQLVVSSDVDGIHYDASEQQKLGYAVAAKVKPVFG